MRTKTLAIFAIATVLLALGLELASSRKAHALSGSLSEAQDWTVSCATTATAVRQAGISANSFNCYNSGSTSVFLGGDDVDTTGYCISSDTATCDSTRIPIDMRVGALFCRVASGTVTLKCLGGR